MEAIFENKEITIIFDDTGEVGYVLKHNDNTFYKFYCDWKAEYENLKEGFLIEMKNHNISDETIEEYKKEFDL